MPRHSPSRSRIDYTGYEFIASAGFDYNYDPVGGRTPPNKYFDPYADYSSPPNYLPQQDYHSTSDYGRSSRDYERSSRSHDKSPRNYRSSRDYYHTPPRYDGHRHNSHNGRKLRGSPRYDDYRDGSDEHSVEASKPVTSSSWKIPQVSLPMPTSTPTSTISDDYIRESEKPSRFIEDPSSSRKLLILDLNGTLVFRSPHHPREYKPHHRRNNSSQNPPDKTSSPPHNSDPYADPTALRPLRTVYPRPYLTPFREYLFHPSTREWLDTMVWSSAQPHSVADMVEKCFGEKKDDLVAIWARDTLGLAAKDYNRKTQTTKDLSKPWAALPLPSSDPRTQSRSTSADRFYSARTTILLDDSPLKAHLQPYNHLCIREYVAELRNADLAFRSSEEAHLRRNAGGLGEQEITLTGSEVQSSASESPVTERFDPNDADETGEWHQGSDRGKLGLEDVNTGKRKRRRRPKHKKQGVGQGGTAADDQMNSSISCAPTSTYDQTLLAVIGILHNIKRQSNIAGWMRSGGPLNLQTQGKREADREGEGSSHLSQGEERKIKRRRTSQELLNADVTAGSLLNTPVIEPYPTNTNGATTTQNNTRQWYEDSLSMAYWVRQGVGALDELMIEIAPGVEA